MQYRFSLSRLTSRVANVALGLAIAGSVATSTSLASAQTFPFPSSNAQVGADRFITSVVTRQEIQALYDRWVDNFIEPCDGNQLRVAYPENTDPPNDTRSEGIGYGMVIAAYMGDQRTFSGLRDYYFAHRDGAGLMNWKYNTCNQLGNNGQGSAADADVDAAFGLIVADRQFPGQNYLADARTLLGAIRGALLPGGNTCPGILLAGTTFANCGCINPSYIPVGYYPAFGAAEQAQAASVWTPARTNSYSYFANISDNGTGLVPAWSQANGALNINCNPEVAGGGTPNEYQADAARTPWRVATDYLWTGDTRAQTFLQDIADFAKRQPRIVHIVDRYQLNGTPLPGFGGGNNPLDPNTLNATQRRASFVMGGFATAMMASSQEDLDHFTGAWMSMYLPGDNVGQPRAFGSSLALLYGLLVTGYMWDPARAAIPVPPIPPTADVAGNLAANGDFDAGILGWSTGNFPDPPDSEAYAMHREGEVHLVIQRNNPEQHYNLQFFQTVSVQAGQRYLLSIRARATEQRRLRLLVAEDGGDNTTYGELVNQFSATEPLTVGTTAATYETVFQAAVTDAQARLAVQFGDSDAEVVIDDIILVPTDRPVTVRGELAGQTPPTDPLNPDGTPVTNPGGTPGTPGSGGTGSTLGPINPSGDPGSPGLQPAGAVPGASGGLPPVSMGRPNGNGTCTMVGDPACNGFSCSVPLGLCYDANGYVWDASQNGGQGGWSLPPSNVQGCGPDYVFWPIVNGCYDPETGYGYDPVAQRWVYIGDNYTRGQDDAPADSGCAVSSVPVTGSSAGWMLVGLLGAAGGLAYRRRRG